LRKVFGWRGLSLDFVDYRSMSCAVPQGKIEGFRALPAGGTKARSPPAAKDDNLKAKQSKAKQSKAKQSKQKQRQEQAKAKAGARAKAKPKPEKDKERLKDSNIFVAALTIVLSRVHTLSSNWTDQLSLLRTASDSS
jgi:hypothetical protein